MLNVSDKLQTITHPHIFSMHMRKDFGAKHQAEDVLVIETDIPDPDYDHEHFDSYLTEILLDLEDLKTQAEQCVGHFDRVDIRTR